jgi:putative membrane protein
MALFDEAGRKRIEQAIAEVEQKTAGEIVVMTVAESDDYRDLRVLYGAAFAIAGAALVHLLQPRLGVSWLFWLQIGIAVLFYQAMRWPPLLRAFVPGARQEAAGLRRAREEFFEHGVYATRDRSGVLIFISELEHRVVLLGDEGIHARIQITGWQEHVRHIIEAIRAGRPADGVCQVLTELGAVLERDFPRRADDRDELSNRVIEEPKGGER